MFVFEFASNFPHVSNSSIWFFTMHMCYIWVLCARRRTRCGFTQFQARSKPINAVIRLKANTDKGLVKNSICRSFATTPIPLTSLKRAISRLNCYRVLFICLLCWLAGWILVLDTRYKRKVTLTTGLELCDVSAEQQIKLKATLFA